MNHIFKTLWSHALQQYVVTNEKQTNRGKAAKSIVSAVAACVMLGAASTAFATYEKAVLPDTPYVEPGKLGDATSWRTQEYKNDWGLEAMHAADAYALGFTGKGAQVGMMDTGALKTHPEFTPERFGYVKYDNGVFWSSGNRYPVPRFDTFGNGKYELGETFTDEYKQGASANENVTEITGAWIPHVNDSHGTHVVGTIGAARNGYMMHGVAFDADVTVANNGGLDNSNYGPFQDYNFYKHAYEKAVAGVDGKAPKFINSSWGTNTRIQVVLKGGKYDGKVGTISLPVNDTKQTEYEYFMFNNQARDMWAKAQENKDKLPGFKMPENKYANFVDGIYEAAKGKDVVMLMTTGNRVYAQPYYRANYPYFNPEAEKQWVAVGGLQQNADGTFENIATFNAPGEGKWWSVVAPGNDIFSTAVCDGTYVDEPNCTLGMPTYDTWGGTSMANPHATGALGVLASRYPHMTATQVRDVMFTTANHKNNDGSTMKGWTAAEGTPDPLYGWGVPDLKQGMFGPGQFLGEFAYNLKDGTDVWTNDISEAGFKARLADDQNWIKTVYEPWKALVGKKAGEVLTEEEAQTLAKDNADKFANQFILGDKFPVEAQNAIKVKTEGVTPVDFTVIGSTNAEGKAVKASFQDVALADAIAWRDSYFEKRYEATQQRLKDLPSLIKDGSGTLVLTGNNTFSGGTTVKNGALYGFATSFGDATQATDDAPNAGKVVVEGGTFGIMSAYNDQLTMKGRLENQHPEGKAAIDVKAGGTFEILVTKKALEGVEETKMHSLALEDGATIRLNSLDMFDIPTAPKATESATPGVRKRSRRSVDAVEAAAPAAEAPQANLLDTVAKSKDKDIKVSAKITADEPIKANADKLVTPDYMKVKQDVKIDGSTMDVTMSQKTPEEVKKTIDGMGLSDNGTEVLAALGSGLDTDTMTVAAAKQTAQSVGSDMAANAQTAVMMNNIALTDALLSQANGFGDAKSVAIGSGMIWGQGLGSWGKVNLGDAKTKTTYYTALVGGELPVATDVKVGAFVGAGHGSLKTDDFGKTRTTDFHVGAYAHAQVPGIVKLTGGVIYTNQKRNMDRVLTVGEQSAWNNNKFHTNIVEVFAEAACPGFNVADVNIDPYVGVNWMHFQGKSFTDSVGDTSVTTHLKTQNVVASSLGVRASVPFTVGSVSLKAKADVSWKHYFGDNKVEYDVQTGNQTAGLHAKKLTNTGNVALGVEANVTKAVTLGLSYQGAFGKDVHSNGVLASFRYTF